MYWGKLLVQFSPSTPFNAIVRGELLN